MVKNVGKKKEPIPVRYFAAPLPKFSKDLVDGVFQSFISSDHASFWYPMNSSVTFPAITIHDMAVDIKSYKECYHKKCDNHSYITNQNLDFIESVIELAFHTALGMY